MPETKPEPVFNPVLASTGKVSEQISSIFKNAVDGKKDDPIKPIDPEPKAEIKTEINAEIKPIESPEPKPEVKIETKLENIEPSKVEKNIDLEKAEEKFKKGESAYAFRMIKQERDKERQEKEEALKAKEEYAKQHQDLQSKIKELEERLSSSPADYEEVKKERDTLNEELAKYAWEKSPEFKANFDIPLQNVRNRIKAALTGTEISEREIDVIISMPEGEEKEERLNAILSALPPAKMTKLGNAIDEYERMSSARQAAIENHQQHSEKLSQSKQEALKQRKAQESKVLDATIEQARKMVPFLKPIEGNEEYNKRIDATLQYAKRMWSGENVSLDQMAEITLAGALLPTYMQELNGMYEAYKAKDAELEAVTKELNDIKNATPKIGAGTGPETQAPANINQIFRKASGWGN